MSPFRVDVVTLFPGMFRGPLDESIPGRAAEAGLVEIRVHDLRAWGVGPHRQVDDAPFGGGGGMVFRPEPLFAAIEAVTGRPAGERAAGEEVVLLAASGRPFTQAVARRYAALDRLVLVCGRYEGVDERVREHACTEALSIGDFVLSGGEPAAACVIDAVVRLLPGALGNPSSSLAESHEEGLLEAPHYTRPAVFRGLAVPETLLSGNHAGIARWRREEGLRVTARLRPDLLEAAVAAGRIRDSEARSAREGASET